MKSFFKKLAAIACKFNIELKRDEKPNDEADSGYDFTLDGVCYTLCTKEILPPLYGQEAVQGWGVCGHKIHPASRKHPEEKEDASIGSSAVAESLVDDVLLAHLKWRIQVEEDGYSHGQGAVSTPAAEMLLNPPSKPTISISGWLSAADGSSMAVTHSGARSLSSKRKGPPRK